MIKHKHIQIDDPEKINQISAADKGILVRGFESDLISIKIPNHLVSNKDKKNYKTGFLNDVYLLLYPGMEKQDVFKRVTKDHDIFVDLKQYQNIVRTFHTEKYSTFIKK